MTEHQRNKYFLEGMTLGEWWEIVGGEEKARKRGISCVVRINPRHHHAESEYSTDNFVCCESRGMQEITFVHSLDPVAFSVGKDSPILLDGHLVVEGHRIRFHGIDTKEPA